jgi:hypothetical protein
MIAYPVKRHGTIFVLDPNKLVLTGFTHSYAEEAFGLMTEPLGHTVRKMVLLLRCIQRITQMQTQMARKFTLQPFRR